MRGFDQAEIVLKSEACSGLEETTGSVPKAAGQTPLHGDREVAPSSTEQHPEPFLF